MICFFDWWSVSRSRLFIDLCTKSHTEQMIFSRINTRFTMFQLLFEYKSNMHNTFCDAFRRSLRTWFWLFCSNFIKIFGFDSYTHSHSAFDSSYRQNFKECRTTNTSIFNARYSINPMIICIDTFSTYVVCIVFGLLFG